MMLAAMATGVCFASGTWRWTRDPIRYDNFKKIQSGMTIAQVVQLLGCQPGDYGSLKNHWVCVCAGFGNYPVHWRGSRGTIIVIFSWNDLVSSVSIHES